MLLSCAEQMLGQRPLNEKLTVIRQAGFAGIDLRWATIAEADARRILADDGLPVGAIYSQLRDPALLAPRAAARAQALDQLRERAEVAAAVGATCLIVVPIFGAAQLRDFAPLVGLAELETALLLALLDEATERLSDVPVTLTLEPLSHAETHFLTDPARAAALCAAIGSPRLATMVDTYHCARNGQDIVAKIAAVGEQLALVHLADTDRQLPGQGTIDFGPPLAALRQHGYQGWLGFECRTVDDIATLRRSVDYLRALWNDRSPAARDAD